MQVLLRPEEPHTWFKCIERMMLDIVVPLTWVRVVEVP
jgi:hypothetical protein